MPGFHPLNLSLVRVASVSKIKNARIFSGSPIIPCVRTACCLADIFICLSQRQFPHSAQAKSVRHCRSPPHSGNLNPTHHQVSGGIKMRGNRLYIFSVEKFSYPLKYCAVITLLSAPESGERGAAYDPD